MIGKLCKKFKFNNTARWNIYKPEVILENKTHRILWDFEIKTEHLSSDRRPELEIAKKKKKKSELTEL